MSFLVPKSESPTSNNTQARDVTISPRETIPLVLGRGRVKIQPVTSELNWRFRTTTQSQWAYFSIYADLALGPLDEIVQIIVAGEPYNGVFRMRSTTPGTFTHVIPKETPERFTFFWGDEDSEDPTSLIQAVIREPAHPLYGKIFPRRRGVARLLIQDMEAGQTSDGQTPPLPDIEIEVNRISPSAFAFGYAAHGTHPIGIIKDLLTLKRGGLKMPASYFNDTLWTAQMQKMMDIGVAGRVGVDLFISIVLSDPKETDNQLADVLSYFGGWLREKNGQIEIDWDTLDGNSSDETGLTEINDHHIAEDDFEEDPADLDGATSLVITNGLDWTAADPLSEANESVPVPIAAKIVGEARAPATYNRPGFTTRPQLKWYSQMMAAQILNPVGSLSGNLLRQYAVHPDGTIFRAGDRFILNLVKYGGTRQIVRITERSSFDSVMLSLKLQRVRGTYPRPPTPTLDPRASTDVTPPEAVSSAIAVEVPEDLQPTDDPYVALLAVRPTVSIESFKIIFSATDVWPGQVIGLGYFWAVAAVVKTALGAGTADAVLDLEAGGDDWSQLTSKTASEQQDDTLLAYHDGEWMSVGTITPTGGGRYDVAVKRGRRSSTPAAHAVSDVVYLIARSALVMVTHRNFRDVGNPYSAITATKYFRLQSYSRLQDGPMPSTSLSVVLGSRAPAEPTNLAASSQLAGIYITWMPSTDSNIAAYEIFVRSAAMPAPTAADIPDFNETGSSRLIPNLSAGDHRWVWIRARNTLGMWSSFVGPVDATAYGGSGPDDGLTPNAITLVTVTPGLGVIWLEWVPPSNTVLSAFRIYESATAMKPSLPTYSVTAPQAFFARTGIGNGITKYFWIEAVATNGRVSATAGPYSATTRAGITLADLVSGLTMVEIVASLPSVANFDGRYVFLATDKKLYRYNGTTGAWTNEVDGADLKLNSVVVGALAAGAVTAYAVGANEVIANTANIANAIITGAKIALLTVDTGNFKDLSVTTLKIAGNAVTVPVYAYSAGVVYSDSTYLQRVQSVTITTQGGPVFIDCSMLVGNADASLPNTFYVEIVREDGADFYRHAQIGTYSVNNLVAWGVVDAPPAGTYTYYLVSGEVGSGLWAYSERVLRAVEFKK